MSLNRPVSMDTLGKGRRAAAARDTPPGHHGGKRTGLSVEELVGRTRTSRFTWYAGAVLVTCLLTGMLHPVKRCIQNVQAAQIATSQEEEAQNENRKVDDMSQTDAERTQVSMAAPRPPLTTALKLPLLPFTSENSSGHTARANRAAGRRPGGKPMQDTLNSGYAKGSAEQLTKELREAEGHKHVQESEDLQPVCTRLNLDCVWVNQLVTQHLLGKNIRWTASTRTAVIAALEKIAELVGETESRQAAGSTPLRIDMQGQRRLLTLQAQRVLEEHLAPPPEDATLPSGTRGCIFLEKRTGEEAQITNYHFAAVNEEKVNVKTKEVEYAECHTTANASTAETSAEGVKSPLDIASTEESAGEQARAGSGVTSGSTLNAEQGHLLFNEAIESLESNTALHQRLAMPLKHESRGVALEHDGHRVTGENEKDSQTRRRVRIGSYRAYADSSQAEPTSVEDSRENERTEEKINETNTVAARDESSNLSNVTSHPLQSQPSHQSSQLLPLAAEEAIQQQWTSSRRGLTLERVESLLQSRVQSRRRRSSARPLIFPSCYFDAPMQLRMREKATVLVASLQQLYEAVEALTELRVLVETQAELVGKAAFALVYPDRLTKEVAKRAPADGNEGEENKGEKQVEQKVDEPAVMAATETGGHRSRMDTLKTSLARSGGDSTGEKNLPSTLLESRQRLKSETAALEEKGQSPAFEVDEHTLKKLVGANGVRKQLREIFASWELARQAAGASEMASEIMRRAETLRRGLVLPLEQELQQLSLHDAILSQNNKVLQRLYGCRQFINAVRRSVSRAEEDLHTVGAHAFASKVGLPLMAHDLQHYLADLLGHIVQSQLEHHRALRAQAASLISLHRKFFRSARELQREATAQLEDSDPGTSPEKWHSDTAQRLSLGGLRLRVDLAKQLRALRSADKKAARLENKLNLLQEGLEHLLHVEALLQQNKRNSTLKRWRAVHEEECKDKGRARNDTEDKDGEELADETMPPNTAEDATAAGIKQPGARGNVRGNPLNLASRVQTGSGADDVLSLELPPKVEDKVSAPGVPADFFGETSVMDEENVIGILQRLLRGVVQMADFLRLYKQQSSDAERLLRYRFHMAQERVQRATGVIAALMAPPLALNMKQRDIRLRDKIPLWARSLQRQGLFRAQAEGGLQDSAALVQEVHEKMHLLDEALLDMEEILSEQEQAAPNDHIIKGFWA